MQLIADQGINQCTYWEQVRTSGKTFADVAESWERLRLPKLALSSQYSFPKLIAKQLLPFFGKMPVESISTGDINNWIATHIRGCAPKTVHNLYKMLRSVVSWHYRQQDKHPKRWSPDLPSLPHYEQRWFTPLECSQIVALAEGQYKVLFHLAASTGMRAGELFALDASDVDFKRGVIRVVRSIWNGRFVPTKGRRNREVFLDSETLDLLRAHLGARSSGLVFQTRNGTPLDDHNVVRQVLKPICNRLQIKPGGMHAFRHGRISHLRAIAVPDDLVRRQVGHSSLRTTAIYTHFGEDFQRDAAEKAKWTQAALLDSAKMAANTKRLN